MKTDYNNLNLTEGLAVFVAAVGIALIGVFGFNALTAKQQAHVAQALQIMDLHEDMEHQAEVLKMLAFDYPQEFLEEFYVAFSEVASLPSETILSWQQTGESAKTFVLYLSDEVGQAYHKNFIESSRQAIALSKMETGQVLGAVEVSWDVSAPAVVLENVVPDPMFEIQIKDDLRGRGYKQPDLKKLLNKINGGVKTWR